MRTLPSVLICDDDEDCCASLFDCFEDLGFDVTAAKDPRTALHLAHNQGYQVALLDMRMPEMNGLELFERLRQDAPDIQGVLISAYLDRETESAARQSGIHRVIEKPARFDEIMQAVRGALDSSSGSRPDN